MDLVRPGRLYDGVHARHRLVVEAKMGRRQLPDLDHVLRKNLFADGLVPFVDLETDGDIHIGHGLLSLGLLRKSSEALSGRLDVVPDRVGGERASLARAHRGREWEPFEGSHVDNG